MKILRGPRQRILDLDFSPDGQSLVASYNDGSLRVWDTYSGEERVIAQPGPHLQEAYLRVGFVQSGRCVVARSGSRGVQVWSVDESKLLKTFLAGQSPFFGGSLAISPTGKWVAATEWSPHPVAQRIHLWDADTWDLACLVEVTHDLALYALAFHPTGARLDTNIGRFAVPGGERLHNLHWDGHRVQWSPDGKWIAWLHNSPTVWVFDATAERIEQPSLERKHVQGFAFSPDSAYLAVVSNEEIVRVWETTTWTEREGFAWGIGKLKCVAFAPDGQRAACGSDRGVILIWDWDL